MILDLYFARRFIRSLLIVGGIFAGLVLMIETLEQVRIFGQTDLEFSGVVRMALLNMPSSMYDLLPIIVVLSTLVLFLGLARSSELVVARASGRGAMRAIVPPLMVAILFGMLTVAVLNPLSSASSRVYDRNFNLLKGDPAQAFSVSNEGLWLREGTSEGQTVIRASRANFNGTILSDVTFLGFGQDGLMTYRIEADEARIGPKAWTLTGAKHWNIAGSVNPEAEAQIHASMQLETQLTPDEIRTRFGAPQAIPIWELPEYIDKLESAGFSARAYAMWFHSELALPATFLAMVLIGAGFTMRHTRLGGTSGRVLAAILIAFIFFFLRNFARILGENGEVPILLAAWGPPVTVILAAMALLLHLEDG